MCVVAVQVHVAHPTKNPAPVLGEQQSRLYPFFADCALA